MPPWDPTGGEAFTLNAACAKRPLPRTGGRSADTIRLRTRAEAKFGEFARQMLFTQAGLEQATRLTVAARHAERFANAGIAARSGPGLRARSRFHGHGLHGHQGHRRGDWTRPPQPAPPSTSSLSRTQRWCTRTRRRCPSTGSTACGSIRRDAQRPRRAPRRIWDPEAFSPPLSFVESVAATGKSVGVKMGPGMPHESVPAGCEAQWVSVGGDVTEVTLWFNASPVPASAARHWCSGRRAPRKLPAAKISTAVPVPAVGPVEGYLYEPDGAVIRAGLVADVALRLGGHLVDRAHRLHLRSGTRGHPVRPRLQGAGGHAVERQSPQGLGQSQRHRCPGHQEARHLRHPRRAAETIAARRETGKSHRGNKTATLVLTRIGEEKVAVVVEPVAAV